MALQDCTLNLNRTGRELQPHGTPDFPCAGYSSVYTDSAGDVVPWHWHEDLEIIYVESGHLRLQVPGKTLHLKQGEGAVVNSNILHFAAAEPLCELHSLVFHPLLVTGEKDSVFSRRYVAPLLQCRSFDICPFDYLAGDLRAGNPAAVFTAAFDAFWANHWDTSLWSAKNCLVYAAACICTIPMPWIPVNQCRIRIIYVSKK